MLMLEKKAVAGACDGYESLVLHYSYTLAIMISSFIYICVCVCVCVYIYIVTSGLSLPFMHGPLATFHLPGSYYRYLLAQHELECTHTTNSYLTLNSLNWFTLIHD